MPTVLVHGVPETAGVWGPLKDLLAGDIVTLSLPGFGTPLPVGLEPTKEAYAEWLTGELASIDEPIRLVAHDWGALLSLRVLASRPANIASWVLDFGNIDDDFAWHALAQLWISPGENSWRRWSVCHSRIARRCSPVPASPNPGRSTWLLASTARWRQRSSSSTGRQ